MQPIMRSWFAAKIKLLVVCAMLAGTAACGIPVQEFDAMPPRVTRISHTYRSLTTLPEPKGKIRVSVYAFRDQTGQYKPLPNVSSFSTAVTQGSVNMLLQALKDSRWFVPVERDGLQNLLTERKIIAAAMRNGGDKEPDLPALESASILLEGGITAYDTNTLTGGFGAKYWGLGGSVQYRQDQVTVHLRAVDVNTGRILKSVSTTKTIFSHEMDAGIFRYLSFKRLLEVEAGYSMNEPGSMCVAAAVEKAVIALVVEGVWDDLWMLKNPEDVNHPVFKEYEEETIRAEVAADLKAAAAKAAADRKAEAEEAALERLRQEEAARLEAERQAREEAERQAREEAARLEAERQAREEAARLEAERQAREEAARLEAERQAQEEAARLEAERQAREEAARLEAERQAREEAARLEAERQAQEEAARSRSQEAKAEVVRSVKKARADLDASQAAEAAEAQPVAYREGEPRLVNAADFAFSPPAPSTVTVEGVTLKKWDSTQIAR
jgi:curli production assembly/transport component CsgG